MTNQPNIHDDAKRRETVRNLMTKYAPLPKTVIHEFNDTGRHRLVVDGVAGEWFGYDFICESPPSVLPKLFGTTEYYAGKLPPAFHVVPLEVKEVYPD